MCYLIQCIISGLLLFCVINLSVDISRIMSNAPLKSRSFNIPATPKCVLKGQKVHIVADCFRQFSFLDFFFLHFFHISSLTDSKTQTTTATESRYHKAPISAPEQTFTFVAIQDPNVVLYLLNDAPDTIVVSAHGH